MIGQTINGIPGMKKKLMDAKCVTGLSGLICGSVVMEWEAMFQ